MTQNAEYVLRGDDLQLAIEALAPTHIDAGYEPLWVSARNSLRRRMIAARNAHIDPHEETRRFVIRTDEEGNRELDALFTADGFIIPELLAQVEQAIREYPVFDARQWLGGVAAIRAVERWLLDPAHNDCSGAE